MWWENFMNWIDRVFLKPNAAGEENKGIEVVDFKPAEGNSFEELLSKAVLNPATKSSVLSACDKVLKNKARYQAVAAEAGCPWHVVAAIHLLESSLNFAGVLHNGEKIVGTGKKTKLVPAGRGPFATWEASAIDALLSKDSKKVNPWNAENTLDFLERYNGLGYRRRGIPSPYLWSFTSVYTKGKYVADGKFDASAVSKQVGCCALFIGLVERGEALHALTVKASEPVPVLPVNKSGTPWMEWMKAREGWNETKNDKELGLLWKHTTYTAGQKAKTVRGKAFAWCAMTVNAALFESGYKGNRSAAAKSFDNYGTPCEMKFGAIIAMRHPKGGRHVTFFHHWVDERKKIAACLGGNQGDALKISNYNFSGNQAGHDQVMGCRWPVKA